MSLTSRLVVSAILAGTGASVAGAQQPDDLIDEILACRSIQDVQARVACFDASTGRLAAARQTGDIVIVEREDVEAVERDSFGFNLPSLPRFQISRLLPQDRQHDAVEPSASDAPVQVAEAPSAPAPTTGQAPDAAPQPAPEEVRVVARDDDGNVDTVTMLIAQTRTVGYQKIVFYMANGQVWRQVDDGDVRLPRRGEMYAEIRRAAMDSYLLRVNGEGRAIRVRREQ